LKLQCDRSIEFPIVRQPYFAHSAVPKFFAKLIAVGDDLSMPQRWQSQLLSLETTFPCRPDEKPVVLESVATSLSQAGTAGSTYRHITRARARRQTAGGAGVGDLPAIALADIGNP
jgi:hypothetical protein